MSDKKPYWANWIEDPDEPHLVRGVECRGCDAALTGLPARHPDTHGPVWEQLDHQYDCDVERDRPPHPTKREPPGFPYPGEEIVYSSARNAVNHEPGEDSWFCVSRPDEEKVHTFGDTEHRNPYRFTIHTPLRGSSSFFVNESDATIIIQGMLSLLADGNLYAGEEPNTHTFNLEWYNSLIADEYDLRSSNPLADECRRLIEGWREKYDRTTESHVFGATADDLEEVLDDHE